MATGDRETRRNSRPLRSDGFLRDLDDDLLSFAKYGVDSRRCRTPIAPSSAASSTSTRAGFAVRLAGLEDTLEIITHVEKRGFFQADVDKRRLHTREDSTDPTLDDVTDDTLVTFALDMKFRELSVFDQRNSGFPEFCVDHDFIAHFSACLATRTIDL